MDIRITVGLASLLVTILVMLVQLSFKAGQQSEKINNMQKLMDTMETNFNGAMGSLRNDIGRKMERLEDIIRSK